MNLSKLNTTLFVAGLAAFASFTAHASSDITVRGMIIPAACTVDVPGGADLDWGAINWSTLDPNKFTTLDSKTVSITINCPQGVLTKTALWINDADPSSALLGENISGRMGHGDSNRIFGIGIDPTTKNKIGNFVLNPVHTIVNGYTNENKFGYNRSADKHNSNPDSTGDMKSWSYSRAEEWSPLDKDNKPALGNAFTWVFDVEPQLNLAGKISPSTRVPWIGTAQVNVRYF